MANNGVDDSSALSRRLNDGHGGGFLGYSGPNGGKDSDSSDEWDGDEGNKEVAIAIGIS